MMLWTMKIWPVEMGRKFARFGYLGSFVSLAPWAKPIETDFLQLTANVLDLAKNILYQVAEWLVTREL